MIRKSLLSSRKGLTLVELMVALVLTAIIGGAAYKALMNQGTSFVRQDQVVEAQQNARVAMDHILRELRLAGYGMSHGYLDDTGVVVMDETGRLPKMVNELGINIGTALTHMNQVTTVKTNNDPNHYNSSDCLFLRRGEGLAWRIDQYVEDIESNNGTNKVRFDDKVPMAGDPNDPDYVLLICSEKRNFWATRVTKAGPDPEGVAVGHEGKMIPKKMIWITDHANSIYSTFDPDKKPDGTNGPMVDGRDVDYNGGTVIRYREVAFYIDTVKDADGNDIPVLMKAMNGYAPQMVGRYIEDLQVAYMDKDGIWYCTKDNPSDPPDQKLIRSIRVSVVARARIPEKKSIYNKISLEDHAVSGADAYLRRVLTSEIKVRNYGLD